MDDRRRFEEYVEKVNALMRSEEFYANFRRRLRASRPELKLNKKDRKKHFELDWIEMIESCITNLDNIVRNPRKFIVVEEDIVDISLARAISTESIKHLAQHTNMIAAVDKEGNVTPNRILNTTKEESFEVYENRFIYTLLKNLSNFVSRRLDAIKMSYVNDHILELTAKANFYMGKTRVFYNLELSGSLPSDPEREAEQSRDIEILQRVTKLQRIISDFLSSPFAKQMVNSAPVRPPITRTNVILKNPDFKKALVLWQFIESYTKMGFQVENDVKKIPVDDKVETAVSDMMCFSNMIMEGLIQGEAQDAAFYDEANITEEDVKEKEVEKAEERQDEAIPPEEEKEVEQPSEQEVAEQVPQPQETPEESGEEGEEESPEDASEDETRPEEEKGEEEELPSDFGIAEIRNMFQQTDTKVTKAELRRINLAIDRVLLAERGASAKRKTDVAEIQSRQQGKEREDLRRQLEKEKETVERVLARKEKMEEKQRQAAERQRLRAERRLKEIEEKLERESVAEQPGEEYEKLEEVVTKSMAPMLATDMTDIDGTDAPDPAVGREGPGTAVQSEDGEKTPEKDDAAPSRPEEDGEMRAEAEDGEMPGEAVVETAEDKSEKSEGAVAEQSDDVMIVPKKTKKNSTKKGSERSDEKIGAKSPEKVEKTLAPRKNIKPSGGGK